MKVLLVALNAKYSHSSLALRYLQNYCGTQFPGLQSLEYNINQDPQVIWPTWRYKNQMWWDFLAISGILS